MIVVPDQVQPTTPVALINKNRRRDSLARKPATDQESMVAPGGMAGKASQPAIGIAHCRDRVGINDTPPQPVEARFPVARGLGAIEQPSEPPHTGPFSSEHDRSVPPRDAETDQYLGAKIESRDREVESTIRFHGFDKMFNDPTCASRITRRQLENIDRKH